MKEVIQKVTTIAHTKDKIFLLDIWLSGARKNEVNHSLLLWFWFGFLLLLLVINIMTCMRKNERSYCRS